MFSKQRINFIDHIFESEILRDEPLKFAQKLAEWLPKAEKWSVCWRGTRDGMKSSKFHSRCDQKKPTLTIVKVIENNKNLVFGGYATESWEGGKSEFPWYCLRLFLKKPIHWPHKLLCLVTFGTI